MRLNVFLQKAGVGSRREAERLVAEGRVLINGTVAQPTSPVHDNDEVKVDGRTVAPATRSQPRLFILNKPLDYLVSASDPQGRKTIYDLPALQDRKLPRLMYVGRLDVNSEGLLLLTDDGPFAQQLMSPETALPRVYRVRTHGFLDDHALKQIRRGVTIAGIRYRKAEIEQEKDLGGRTNAWYRITLYEGKNREIRKLVEHFGCKVNRLLRESYGPFGLGELERGKLREVRPEQVSAFVASLG